MKIKILIDGYYLSKPRGLGRYAQELINALGTHYNNKFELHICVPDKIEKEFIDQYKNVKFHFLKNKPFPLWEQFLIPMFAKRIKADIVHSPYNTKPIMFNFFRIHTLTTIHDLMFLDKTHKVEGYYQKIGNLYRKLIVKLMKTKYKNENVVTVSETSKDEIEKLLNIKAHVVYTPVDYFYLNVKDHIQEHPFAGSPYIYHVGGISPHKNTERVIKAFKKSALQNVKLVISGCPKDCNLARKYENDQIVFTGWLKDYEIATFYKNAEIVVFPSLREGYGLPIVEAFKFKTPLITSNINPLREIAGEGAYLVNPLSIDELSHAIKKVFHDQKLKSDLVHKGASRGKIFTSKEMAKKMYSLYERIYYNEKGSNS
jgi:glycosyltransferase involved in cell wall biosynthesis